MTRLKPGGKVVSHPARYSTEILVLFRFLLRPGTRVHDPFAGTGERLGALADERGLVFTGTDLERAFIVDKRVKVGNACDVSSYPAPGFTIATSPVYPNGMADDYNAQERCKPCRATGQIDGADCAKCKGTGKRGHHRRTYRSALAKMAGHDVTLDPDNQARWGYRGRPLHSAARLMYWGIADRSVIAWTEAGADRLLVNVSDFTSNNGRRVEPVVDTWARTIMAHGWTITKAHKVPTQRFRDGANADERAEYEVVLDCRRTAVTSESSESS